MSLNTYFTKARLLWDTPGNRGQRASWLLLSVLWFFHKRISKRPWHISVYGGMKFACHPESLMAEHLLYRSEYFDYDEMKFIHDFLQPGDCFLDVGANIGLYTLLAATRVQGGPIFSVEPHPANLKLLRENLEANHLTNVQVLAVAAGAEDSEATLSDSDVFAGVAAGENSEDSGPCVPVRRLDALLGSHSPAVTKVDVEGYEWGVFRGLSESIAAGRLPIVLFELIGHMTKYGHSEKEFCAWWRDLGYRLATYSHEAHCFTFADEPGGDVFAISPPGLAMIKARMPQVKFAG
jgi:FkbM family methyltransferase